MQNYWLAGVATAVVVGMGSMAEAARVNLTPFNHHGQPTHVQGWDIWVDVYTVGTRTAFKFQNDSAIRSSLTDIYFDDGHLLDIYSIEWGTQPQVRFEEGATPKNLPGGNDLTPPFKTSQPFTSFSADSNAPVFKNGVNQGEWVTILFTLKNNADTADVLDDLQNGSLRVGVHVQGLPRTVLCEEDGSISAVNTKTIVIPEPATMTIFALGAAGLLLRRRGA